MEQKLKLYIELNQAVQNWHCYDGFALATTREQQSLAKKEQQRLANIVIKKARAIKLATYRKDNK